MSLSQTLPFQRGLEVFSRHVLLLKTYCDSGSKARELLQNRQYDLSTGCCFQLCLLVQALHRHRL